jgi:hypothetical protein
MLERDVRLRHEKEDEKVESTRKQIEREQHAIHESRQHQLICKLQNQQAEKTLAELRARDWATISKQQLELDCQKQLAKRAQNIELRNIHQQQIRENEERRAKDIADAFEEEQQVGIAIESILLCSHRSYAHSCYIYSAVAGVSKLAKGRRYIQGYRDKRDRILQSTREKD